MSARVSIIKEFDKANELTVNEISERLDYSKQTIHSILKELVEENLIEKLGRSPKTVYRLAKKSSESETPKLISVPMETGQYLNENFLVVTDSGKLLEGLKAFEYWCRQRKEPVAKTLEEFLKTKKKYEAYYDRQGNVNGLEKLKSTKGYEKIWLDELYYLDFYAIERFGKTRLGTLLHYAKQGQNKFLMSIMQKEIAPRIREFVKEHQGDAIGFVPPTIRRELQLMKYIQTHLKIALPIIDIKKLSGIIPVPQKSLSKLDERIRNAENTFAVTDQRTFKHLVLIDDAVGSGSTLNQIAEKIKNKNIAEKITGLAIVGSFKGFDVITDV
jgi:DNA-binding Lrp family transcriptional regulator